MNKYISIIFCVSLIFSSSAFAQESKKPVKIIKEVESKVKQKKIKYLDVEAKDESFLNNKDLWNGYDFEAIATAVKSAKIQKNEFESSEEFESRKNKEIEKPIYSSIGLNSRIAIVIPEIKKIHNMKALGKDDRGIIGYFYDADSKKLKIFATGEAFTSKAFGSTVETVVISKPKSSKYIGQNSFGAKVEVSSIGGEHINIAIPTGNGYQIEFDIDGNAAQELLNTSGIVLTGRLKEPYFEESAIFSKATITSPIEIMINVTRLLFTPERIFMINRESRKIIQAGDY